MLATELFVSTLVQSDKTPSSDSIKIPSLCNSSSEVFNVASLELLELMFFANTSTLAVRLEK